jgi:hypothetical protein
LLPVAAARREWGSPHLLNPFTRNARTHTKHQIKLISESIKTFGFNNPILTDESNTIIADNRIAEKAGWDESILAIELQHLVTVDLGFDITITGFEVPEIELILQQAEVKPDADDTFETIRASRLPTGRPVASG